jgi:hypothetical protein
MYIDYNETNEELEIEFIDLSDIAGDDKRTHVERHEESEKFPDFEEQERRITRSSLTPRFSNRQRRVQLVGTASFIALALLVLVVSYAPARQMVARAFTRPVTPTATLAPGIDHFYVNGSPSWGHLLVDGKPVAHLPNPNRSEPPLRLSHGTHTLTWIADPFPARNCVVSVPPNYHVDNCDFNSFIQTSTGSSGWIFSFPISLLDLDNTQQNALVQTVQRTLAANAPTEIVHSGEPYATSSPRQPIAIATQPLQATLDYRLDTTDMSVSTCSKVLVIDNGDCAYEGQDCHLFCSASQLFSEYVTVPSSEAWDVLAVVSYRWEYRAMNGTRVATDQPDQVSGIKQENHLMPLQITWDGMQWHVVSNTSLLDSNVFSGDVASEVSPGCASAISNVEGSKTLAQALPSYAGTNWSYVSSSANAATGCLGIVTFDTDLTPDTPSPSSPAYCLHRFGVFVAANSTAHTFWPNMPLATPYEQQLAQQLANLHRQS